MENNVISVAKVKKRSIVFYKKFLSKRYNENSKKNLVQNFNKKISNNKLIQKLRNQKEVECINNYVDTLKIAYDSSELNLKTDLSVTQAKKISEITNVFIESVLSQYKQEKGFKQRSVTFVTLTLTQKQMHTDKELIKMLVDFIDHLKKVNNYLICPVTKQETKEKALPIRNYIWRAETMQNGNIHFHLLFDTFFNMYALKRVWNNYLQKYGYFPSNNSASINPIKNLRDVGAYVTKYLTKPNLNKDGSPRRPIIGKQWGCSKDLLSLKYLEFTENDIPLLNEVVDQMQKVDLKEEIKDFITVYSGNVRSILKKCSQKLQSEFKYWYKKTFDFIYKEKNKLSQVMQPIKININYTQLDLF